MLVEINSNRPKPDRWTGLDEGILFIEMYEIYYDRQSHAYGNKIKFYNNFYCCFAAWAFFYGIPNQFIDDNVYVIFSGLNGDMHTSNRFIYCMLYIVQLAWSRKDDGMLTINHVNLNIV